MEQPPTMPHRPYLNFGDLRQAWPRGWRPGKLLRGYLADRYGLCLALQNRIVRRAAGAYGVRLVTTVVARVADRPPSQAQ